MIATNFFQRVHNWRPMWSWSLARIIPRRATPSFQQITVQAHDFYFLDAGSYRLRVLAGNLWIAEHGIIESGEQLHLVLDAQGEFLRPVDDRPVVFRLQSIIDNS